MKPMIQLSRTTLLSNRWIKVSEDRTQNQNGQGTYYVVDRPDAVVIVIQDTDGCVLMVRQFRYPTDHMSLEFPMGAVESGESVEVAARRELREETGIDVQDLICLPSFFPVPGLSPQKATPCFCRCDVPFREVPAIERHEAGEEILGTVVVPAERLLGRIECGEVTDGFTLSTIGMLTAMGHLKLG